MFKKSKPNSDATPQKITPTVLSSSLDEALNQAFGTFGGIDGDELIAQTGKSRKEIYDICLADDEVDACRDDLESAMTARAWRIFDEKDKDKDSDTINKFYKVIERHLKTFVGLAIMARFNGYALAEYTYAQDEDGFIYIDQVLSKEGELDKFTLQRDGSVLYDQNGTKIAVNTEVKLLKLTHRATPSRPMGQMSIIKIYPAVLLRQKGWAYAGQFIARYAQPYVVGKQGNDFGLGIGTFTQKIFGFVNGGAAGIGRDDDIEIHQLSGDGTAFELIERLANKRIQKLLLGRVKTSELANGSRAAQQTDDDARTDRIGSYLDLMKEAITHAINAMIAVNNQYAKPISPLWFEYIAQADIDIKRAERDKLYADTGQVKFTKKYLMDMVGFEEHHFEIVDSTTVSLALSENYTDFEKYLLGDELVKDLTKQMDYGYLDGLKGIANKDGEMGIEHDG